MAADLAVTAVSPDGAIEAVEHRGRPNATAVQWHPEYVACTAENNKIAPKVAESALQGKETEAFGAIIFAR